MICFFKKFFVFAKPFIFSITFLFVLTCSVTDAKNGEKIGIFYSYRNADAYGELDVSSFESYWKSFTQTIEKTYLDTQYLCNISTETMPGDLGVDVILFPLAIDIDQIEANYLGEFIRQGGKLVISTGPSVPSERLKSFLLAYDVLLKQNFISSEALNIKHKVSDISLEIPIGAFYSDFEIHGFGEKTLARWKENSNIAIAGKNNLVYIGYPLGNGTDRTSEITLILSVLDFYFPGIIYNLEKEIAYEEYENILKNLLSLRDKAQYAISIIDELNLSVPYFELKKHYNEGLSYLQKFGSYYLTSNYLKARQFAYAANNNLSLVLSLAVPVRKAEIRAVWIDRETIVNTQGPRKLKRLIKDIADTGFNVVFLETINAGYPIYPSMLLEQNPMIMGWDPLQVAIEEAHENNIELHAWVWTFAVGNSKHNIILGKRPDFPGPVISKKGRRFVLAGKNGKLRIQEQPEVWVSPANTKACNFLSEVFSEVVQNYDVDGLQLDYIRFPFQGNGNYVGFDFASKIKFKKEVGYFPSLKGDKYKKWVEWKTKEVNDFVENIGRTLKKIKPELSLSVAVFAISKDMRIERINQDWETWALNKWVDVVYPFYYSYTKEEIKEKYKTSVKDVNGNVIIVPAFNLQVLNEGELSEKLIAARDAGALGTALFAYVHLDKAKKDVLVNGPYRNKAEVIPYQEPRKSLIKLFDEFVPLVDRLVGLVTDDVLSPKEVKNDVRRLIEELRSELKYNEAKNIEILQTKLGELEQKIYELMILEKYIGGESKTVFLDGYITQLNTLLYYIRSNEN